MASTLIIYLGTGSQTDFAIPFDYLKKSFVTVSLLGTPLKGGDYGDTGADYYFLDKTTIRIKVAPKTGQLLMVRRITSSTLRVVTFKDASVLKATDMDTSQLQAFHIAQLAKDIIYDSVIQDEYGNWDARGNRIVNVKDPVALQDAVTLNYLQNFFNEGVVVPGSVSYKPQALTSLNQWQARDNITALGGYEYVSLKSKLVALQLDKIKEMYDSNIAFKNLLNRKLTLQTDYDCFIIAGQSNSVGQGLLKSLLRATDCGLYLDWTGNSTPSANTYKLKPIADPICRSKTGTAWPAFARLYKKLTGRNVLLLSTGWGGSCVVGNPFYTGTNTWALSGVLRTLAKANWNALVSQCRKKGITYSLKGLLWIQGEALTGLRRSGTITLLDYRDATYSIWEWFRLLTSSPNLPIFFSRIGSHTNQSYQSSYKLIGDYQLKTFPSIDNNIYLAFNKAPLFIQTGLMSGSVHYTQEGYNMMGLAFARKITTYKR